MDPAKLLRWYVEMGADEAIGAAPGEKSTTKANRDSGASAANRDNGASAANRDAGASAANRDAGASAAPARPEPAARPVEMGSGAAGARAAARAAQTLEELGAAVRDFAGCALKKTATNTVFVDGTPGAPLLVIGEAPGAEEDRLGLPFVGRSGQLLDRMLAAIGRDRRTNAFISNVLFWRPPGNRKPTDEETAQCLPFVLRLVALARPRVVMLCGGTATAAMLGKSEGITRLRGKWFAIEAEGLDRPVPTLATYHPSFLLRSPARKGEAWRDLLSVQSKLESRE